jgi:FkbM family methyltransferase
MGIHTPRLYHKFHDLVTDSKQFFKSRRATKLRYKQLGIPYGEVLRLKNLPNITDAETPLFNKKIKLNSPFWYLFGIEEIFFEKQYYFIAENQDPYIIDCGANIGLSIIFFKTTYPGAQVVGIEADKKVFDLLENNIRQFDFSDIQLLNNAVWINENMIPFEADSGVGGRATGVHTDNSNRQVKGIRLKDLLDRPVDFLKVDIEGVEVEVLEDCRHHLHMVKNLFVEYHSGQDSSQQLDKLLAILSQNDFRYYIKEAWDTKSRPFVEKQVTSFFDLQLNIFAFRNSKL